MSHPLASDSTLDPILRKAFARVRCQIVRTYDDGSEGVINMTDVNRATAELTEHRNRIGRTFGGEGNGGGIPKRLLSVQIREI